MRYAIVNGERHPVVALHEDQVVPGARLKAAEGRRVYRVLAFDGPDVVMRNVRHLDDITAYPRDEVLGLFLLVLPEVV